MKLYFPEITFSAAHYIPNHEKCSGLHGHTYFVRNLEVILPEKKLNEQGMSVDFGVIKRYFKEQWDHKLLVPKEHDYFWNAMEGPLVKNKVMLEHTTAEWMAMIMKKDLEDLILFEGRQINEVHFELWEGPNQAVKV